MTCCGPCSGVQMGAIALRASSPRLAARPAFTATARPTLAARPAAIVTRAPALPAFTGRRPPALIATRPATIASGVVRSPVMHPDDADDRPGGSMVQAAAQRASAALAVPTSRLREAARIAGASPAIVEAPRRVLVQALGLPAAAKLGGQSPDEAARLAQLSRAAIDAAGLDRPDPVLLFERHVSRWGAVPIGAFLGSGLGSIDGPGGGSASDMPTPGSTPGAVQFRPGNWTADFRRYAIAPGDSMYGLAITYLGGLGSRWMEIWSLQPWRYTKCPDPACVATNKAKGIDRPLPQVGELLEMPPEAQERARRWAASSDVPKAPPTPGAPGYGNDAPGRPDAPSSGGSFFERHKVPIIVAGIGVGAAALVLS